MGCILAAVGSAVGLGNIWRFPFVAGQGGGAGFLLVYLLFIVFVGFPAILVECVVGRKTERNPVGAMAEIGRSAWKYVGWISVITTFVIMSYYSVIAGWTVRYTLIGLQDNFATDSDTAGEQFLLGLAPAADLMLLSLYDGLADRVWLVRPPLDMDGPCGRYRRVAGRACAGCPRLRRVSDRGVHPVAQIAVGPTTA